VSKSKLDVARRSLGKIVLAMLVAALDAPQIVQGVDLALMICGGLCAGGFAIWLVRRGNWRNPLAGVRAAAVWRTVRPAEPPTPETGAREPNEPVPPVIIGPEGPTLSQIVIALFAYVIVSQVAARVFLGGQDLQAASQPSTQAWYLLQAADIFAKLLVALLMIFMLAQHPLFPPGRAGAGPARKSGIGLLTALILTAITFPQLQMGSIIWQWLNPGQALPIHPVLLALKEGTVGVWGQAILLIAAVVAAPLSEELFFRGLVLGAVWRVTSRAWVAVIVSGLAFGAVHGQPQDILPLCTMGMVLGYVRLRTRSLVPTIIAHGLFNARTMAIALLVPQSIS
jgi:membrane protease YdiL (CAAX protease family)